MRRAGTQDRGFTLLELVLVMVIITIGLAAVAPSLRGWSRGARLNAAAEQLVATARRARAQAISDGAIYRLNISRSPAQYWLTVQSGQEFSIVQTGWGRTFDLPEGYQLELTQSDQSAEFVEFYPTGRTQVAKIRIVSDQGEGLTIQCTSPSERFEIVREAQS